MLYYKYRNGRVTMTNWMKEAIVYHIYPLGFCGCEAFSVNEQHHRINKIKDWIPHLKKMHINAVYLGPVNESHEHGYDTSDYFKIDRRLGTNEDFKEVCELLHQNGIRVILDGVLNHVGRSFWAFQDVIVNKQNSLYVDWFANVNFSNTSPFQDSFSYEAWEGHYNLVKLNLKNEKVVQHLLDAVGMWIDEFHIDGLRLDAAHLIDLSFFKRLKHYCNEKNPEFWLMGEIIHGDYNIWANKETLDSVTNYECYKGIYSSHNEKNYFEIAHSLNRQFGKGGIYHDLYLYNFVDNHDVNRIASVVKKKEDLKNIYTLLYTMPGIPSIYYGSEWEIEGKKHDGSDADVRPNIDIESMNDTAITQHIEKLGSIYSNNKVFQYGAYEQVIVKNEQFVFKRYDEDSTAYVIFNVSDDNVTLTFPVLYSVLKEEFTNNIVTAEDFTITITIPSHDCAILTKTDNIGIHKIDEITKEDKNIEITTTVSETIKIGRYRHFKGMDYAVLYTAKHSETLEEYVVYRQLYGDGEVWIRPLTMFTEVIEKDGKQIPRFEYIGK